MANLASGQPPMEIGQSSTANTQPLNPNPVVNNILNYSNILKPSSLNALMHANPTMNTITPIPIKHVVTF